MSKKEQEMKAGLLSAVVVLLSTSVTSADIFGTGPNQFSIDFVNIGHAGNTSDPLTGYGAVDHNYRIGKYEITVNQLMKAYAEDNRISNGNEDYWNDGVRTVGINAPVSQITWSEAAMFCNWLTSGDAYSGAYQFDGSGVFLSTDRSTAVSAYGTVFVMPTEDEWYKAAYYRPDNHGSYSLYASGLDAVPAQAYTTGWNYYDSDEGWLNGAPNYTWITGSGAEEQNGTFDMMGNVAEWTEAVFYPGPDIYGSAFRGGSYGSPEGYLSSIGRDTEGIIWEKSRIGFRVAAIPEPSSILLLTIGAGGVFFYRRATAHQMRTHPSRWDRCRK